MHSSAYNHMKAKIEKYLVPGKPYDIVEIGSRIVDEQKLSHRTLLGDFRHSYIGLDVEEGLNVDVVMREPYRIPLSTASVDVVISGQVFEHVPFFWVTFMEMARILRPNGYIFLTAPSRGHVHASKQEFDCWRFYPDSMRALGAFANLDLLEVHTDFPPRVPQGRAYDYTKAAPSQYWGDTVAAFRAPEKRDNLDGVTETMVVWANSREESLARMLADRQKG
ncbi:methyltransferase domain-containing protein [Bosea sp. NPDC055353]